MTILGDEDWMRLALQQAQIAARDNEVPVGAVVVQQGQLIGSGHNLTQAQRQIHTHAELVALGAASRNCGLHQLAASTLYVTLEPCLMCLGAIVQARLARLVFGAYEPQTGALVSHYQLAHYPGHNFDWRGGVLQQECARLMQDFFLNQRRKQIRSGPLD